MGKDEIRAREMARMWSEDENYFLVRVWKSFDEKKFSQRPFLVLRECDPMPIYYQPIATYCNGKEIKA